MDNSDLAKRMKAYEAVSKTSLMKRCPVIMRLDGKAFHTFTRGFARPFDLVLQKAMQDTMKYLCENIQGCVLGYTESDEISLVLIDYMKLNSAAWFDYEVEKMCSVGASMTTMAFNKSFEKRVDEWGRENLPAWDDGGTNETVDEELIKLCDTYTQAIIKGALFDCRVFNVPKEDVTNCIYWRQLDASRNSIQMVGQANFSHKELQYKSCNNIQDMLMLKKGINWNDFSTTCKRGSCCKKIVVSDPDGVNIAAREQWRIDNEIPLFKGEGRDYIDSLIFIGE